MKQIKFLDSTSRLTLPLGYMDEEKIEVITKNNIESGKILTSEFSSLFNSEMLCALAAKPISKMFNL